jgi:hypothetical protein
MSIVLQGSTSGSVTLQEPAVAGTTVLDLPATSGTVALTSQLLASPSAVGQIPFSTDGSTYTATAKIVSGTAVASTSGTSIDFTSIPSWVKRITVMFYRISTNGTSSIQVQLGDSGGVETTGYEVTSCYIAGGAANAADTSGFVFNQIDGGAASGTQSGQLILNLISGNRWIGTGALGWTATPIIINAGSKELSATLDRVRITTVNGTDTFDAGSINILYE